MKTVKYLVFNQENIYRSVGAIQVPIASSDKQMFDQARKEHGIFRPILKAVLETPQDYEVYLKRKSITEG